MPWYRYGSSKGGYGNGPYRDYGPLPYEKDRVTAAEVIDHFGGCDVTVKVFWSNEDIPRVKAVGNIVNKV